MPRKRFSPDRRRLLVTGGTGAAAWALLREAGAPSAGRPEPDATPGTTTTAPTGPVSVAGADPVPPDTHLYDTVIAGGRVMDPASGFDDIANVGIDAGRISAISDGTLRSDDRIDAAGLVVAPGFIDLMSYQPNDYGIWFKIADGVTTNLGMHGINMVAEDFFGFYAGRTPCHFGGAFDNPFMRSEYLDLGIDEAALPWHREQLAGYATDGIASGWAGIDFEPEYTPGVDTDEIISLATIAAAHQVPVFFHVRYSDPDRNAEAIAEVIDIARSTGAAVHVDHITSTGGTHTMAESLATIQAARDAGLAVTADLYPYDSWATFLQATRFGPDPDTGASAVERFGINYSDLQIVGTEIRLTESEFAGLRASGDNRLVAALGSIPETDIVAALQADFTLIGSDSILEVGDNNHPRGAGCFARTLGRYVREEGVLDLMAALSKMTAQPAALLEAAAPAMALKGRLQIGADADITVFDPERIIDRSTVAAPAQESEGVTWVLVAGTVVKGPEGLRREQLPGLPIRAVTS